MNQIIRPVISTENNCYRHTKFRILQTITKTDHFQKTCHLLNHFIILLQLISLFFSSSFSLVESWFIQLRLSWCSMYEQRLGYFLKISGQLSCPCLLNTLTCANTVFIGPLSPVQHNVADPGGRAALHNTSNVTGSFLGL